jgi:hypothetical protein
MLLAGLRRFGLLLAVVAGTTAVIAAAVGAASGTSVDRSVAVGFYLVGVIAFILGVHVATRPPVRGREGGGVRETAVPWRIRGVRWAERRELEEAINSSAVLVTLGAALVVIGIAVDGRHSFF